MFAGSFDARRPTAIAAGDGIEAWDVLDALTELVAKSMVIADERTVSGNRYQLLETLRAYAASGSTSGCEADTWRRAHAEHYAAFAEDAPVWAMVSADELEWRRRLRDELDNIRAAVTWSLDVPTMSTTVLAFRIVAGFAGEANRSVVVLRRRFVG